MTKKAFYEKIAGKKVIIDNLEYIEKLINKNSKNTLLVFYSRGIFKEWKEKGYKLLYKVENEEIKIKVYKDKKENATVVASGGNYYNKMKKIHSLGLDTIVKSKELVINGCYFDKKNIEILTENTFKTCNSECIYRILD